MHPPRYPTLPQLLKTPENDCDPENDENLSTYDIESDAEVLPEDDSKAAEDSHDEADVNHDIPPPPVDLFYDTLEEALEAIREFTKEHRYALTKPRSKKGPLVRTELRPASRFEVALQEGRGRRGGRGRPRGSTQETTPRRIIPDNGQPQPPVTSAPGVNQQTSERGRSRGRSSRGRDGRGGRGGSTSRIDGIPDTMLNDFQL